MRLIKIWALIGVVMMGLISCGDEAIEQTNTNTNTTINKIMALGASRVEGNRPQYESFRYETWKDLIENNYSIDFIVVFVFVLVCSMVSSPQEMRPVITNPISAHILIILIMLKYH